MTSLTIQPCECCGNAPIITRPAQDEVQIVCRRCSNEGPVRFSRFHAIEAWNAARQPTNQGTTP